MPYNVRLAIRLLLERLFSFVLKLMVILNFIPWIWMVVKTYTYRFGKWLLRHLTHLCQLQRIIYGELPGSKRIRLVEASLRSSRSDVVAQALKNLALKVDIGYFDTRNLRRVEVSAAAHAIANAKGINIKCHTGFVPKLADCLEMMYSYEDLRMKLENTRAIRYAIENNSHETKLLEIWKNFMYPEELSGRKSRQWQYLGFQGNDPSTDFRASGELGLNFILYFSRTYQERAKQVLGVSNHPMYSFPLAILMIQIGETGFQLFRRGQAKTHFYNRHSTILSLDEGAKAVDFITRAQGLVGIFYDFCCVLLIEFTRFWLSKKPKNIMAFPPIYEEFVNMINERLKDDESMLLMDIQTI
ncbi:unnamed protein product [Orchesella dallaii]|uniref:ELMO domain-containing protein n=1 Tax=Orchesella dallaii TaxID=48710 RepID=A0ABP1R561_9HEXA